MDVVAIEHVSHIIPRVIYHIRTWIKCTALIHDQNFTNHSRQDMRRTTRKLKLSKWIRCAFFFHEISVRNTAQNLLNELQATVEFANNKNNTFPVAVAGLFAQRSTGKSLRNSEQRQNPQNYGRFGSMDCWSKWEFFSKALIDFSLLNKCCTLPELPFSSDSTHFAQSIFNTNKFNWLDFVSHCFYE